MSENTVMSPERRKQIIIRYAALFMALTAAFWGIWSLFAPVPEVRELAWNYKTGSALTLPFALSRWWDVLFAGIWTAGIAWAVTHPKMKGDEDHGLVIGFVAGIVTALLAGFGIDLDEGIFFGLGAGLYIAIGGGLGASLGAGLGAGVGLGAAFNHAISLGAGLAVGLSAGLIIALGATLGVGLKTLYSARFWRRAGYWLSTKDGIPTQTVEAEPRAPETSPLEARYAQAVGKETSAMASLDAARAERERLEADLGGATEGAKVIAISAERL